MTIEYIIETKLAAIGVAYPLQRPAVGGVLPCMVYQFIGSGQPARHHGGTTKLRRRLQVACWASSYAAATTLGDGVRVALDGDQNNIELITAENNSDFKEPDAKLFRRLVEFFVWE